jgi:hypothetical protein
MNEPILNYAGMYKFAEGLLKKGYGLDRVKYELANEIHSKGAYLGRNAKELLIDRRLYYKGSGAWSAIRHPIATFKHKVNPSYLDRTLSAAAEIYDFAQAGGHLQSLPSDLAGKITELKNLDFYDAMVHILRKKGIIWGSVMRGAKHVIRKKAQKGIRELVEETKRIAVTSILLAASFLLLGFSAGHMTGFVIASKEIPAGYPIAAGFILLIIALCLSFLRKKKTNKKQTKRRKGRKR